MLVMFLAVCFSKCMFLKTSFTRNGSNFHEDGSLCQGIS